jgi:hypothetical protein
VAEKLLIIDDDDAIAEVVGRAPIRLAWTARLTPDKHPTHQIIPSMIMRSNKVRSAATASSPLRPAGHCRGLKSNAVSAAISIWLAR